MPTESTLASRVEEILCSHSMWRMPVDPFAVAREEDIEVVAGEFRPGFDGRIRYLPEVDTYVLAYRGPGAGRPRGRVSFTIAHELGHYVLHRQYLRSGRSHSSVVDFRSNDEMEQEADQFAAALLMPMPLFSAAVREFHHGVCVLRELCELADRFGTSVTSTVRRYCQSDIEPVAALFSESGIVRWGCYSEDMRRLGMGYVPFGESVAAGSVTGEALANGEEFADGERPVEIWFPRAQYSGAVWEESLRLGFTGVTVTYLTLCENPWPDEEP